MLVTHISNTEKNEILNYKVVNPENESIAHELKEFKEMLYKHSEHYFTNYYYAKEFRRLYRNIKNYVKTEKIK